MPRFPGPAQRLRRGARRFETRKLRGGELARWRRARSARARTDGRGSTGRAAMLPFPGCAGGRPANGASGRDRRRSPSPPRRRPGNSWASARPEGVAAAGASAARCTRQPVYSRMTCVFSGCAHMVRSDYVYWSRCRPCRRGSRGRRQRLRVAPRDPPENAPNTTWT
ncbi:MAG: hypothetical protein QOJ84_2386 [Bradyrhizobium sp.]|nr:hypothetical protein [Bradyrhizobium sp.]